MASKDGKRRPPRPQIEIVTGGASEEEAAAIASALEQFLVETAPAPSDEPPVSHWQTAALREAVQTRANLEPPRPRN
jgi:hypothetical protein